MPAVEELYDELTLRRIERGAVTASGDRRVALRRRVSVGAGRRALGGGALLTAVALGLQEALDPADDEPVVEEIRPADDAASEPAVLLFLVPGAPRLSRAIVRPWLL